MVASVSAPAPFWRVFGSAWLLLALLSGLWAISTPIGAAPDEPAHLIKAASVVRGEFIGDRGPHGEVVQVPRYIAFTHAQTCFAFDEDQSAECMLDVPGDTNEIVDATTTAGLYNPLYYLIVGWPSLIATDSSGVFAMRLVSTIVVSFVLALAFALISTWRRPTLPMLGGVVAITPMVLFLNGTVNPNSLEIATILTAFVGVFTVLKHPEGGHLIRNATIIFTAAAAAANMRGLSLLWLAVALVTPFMLVDVTRMRTLLKRRPVYLAITGTAVAVVAAAIWLLSTNSLGASIDEPGPVTSAPGVGTSPLFGFIWTILSTFHYAEGMVGVFGWLDTPAPEIVYFIWSLLGGGILVLAFALSRGRQLALTATLTLAVLLLPPLLQGYYITEGGVIWQGRYILPLFVCMIVAAAAAAADHITLSRPTQSRLLVIVLALWGIGQFQSYATAMRRYAVGFDGGWLTLLEPEWTPPGGIWALLIGFILVLTAAMVGIYATLTRAESVRPSALDRFPQKS